MKLNKTDKIAFAIIGILAALFAAFVAGGEKGMSTPVECRVKDVRSTEIDLRSGIAKTVITCEGSRTVVMIQEMSITRKGEVR